MSPAPRSTDQRSSFSPRVVQTPILLGQSGAQVCFVQQSDGSSWIEKHGPAQAIAREAAVLKWCVNRLPTATILQESSGSIRMSVLPGTPLSAMSMNLASFTLADAIRQIHAVPFLHCPFSADWDVRLFEASERIQAGLVDESDFDQVNQGRSAFAVLAELRSLPPLPDGRCFTHGDASLENFLMQGEGLSGIVDLGRAGVTHPAQDWALALRSMRHQFGQEGERSFRSQIPFDCADEALLRRFCLLDELF